MPRSARFGELVPFAEERGVTAVGPVRPPVAPSTLPHPPHPRFFTAVGGGGRGGDVALAVVGGEPGSGRGCRLPGGSRGGDGPAPRGCLWRHGCPLGFPVPSPSPARGYDGARDLPGRGRGARARLRARRRRASESQGEKEESGRHARVTVERSGRRRRRRGEGEGFARAPRLRTRPSPHHHPHPPHLLRPPPLPAVFSSPLPGRRRPPRALLAPSAPASARPGARGDASRSSAGPFFPSEGGGVTNRASSGAEALSPAAAWRWGRRAAAAPPIPPPGVPPSDCDLRSDVATR